MNVRYVRPLTEQQRALLESTIKNDASHRARMRAHGLVLSSEGITIKAIAKIYHVDRDTVATWIKKWEKHGEKSLHDQPRSGRPSTLNATEKELAKQYIQEEPRSLKQGAALLLRCLEPSYPSPLMSCVVISLFLQQSVAMWGEPWASLRILPGDCVGTPVVRGRPSTHQNRH